MAINLLTQLLQMDPERRPSAVEALEHPYFAKYHFPKDEVGHVIVMSCDSMRWVM